MALPVDVRSIDDLRAVREALILFADDAGSALGAMDSELRRCLDWLAHEQRLHWQNEVKRRKEKLSEAKAELHRKQLSKMFGQHSHDSEQRENVREAKHRLEEAEDKVELVHRWVPIVERAAMEYGGQARPFGDVLEFDVERSVGLIDAMIHALEDYMQITAPETAGPAPAAVSGAAVFSAPHPAPAAAEPKPEESADAGKSEPEPATEEAP